MPGRLMCFVCGSPGAETTLRIRQYEREPYFPFLQHHDPPKGSRLPTADGNIDSCRVCFMFLTQQWESYERSNTPAVKRLYWLKRSDNGNFTGAEMRIQGEYIAQVMGLQYPPGFDDGGSPENSNMTSDRDYAKPSSGSSIYPYPNVDRDRQNYKSHSEVTSNTKDSALDLSTPKKDAERHNYPESHHRTTKDKKFICYVCGQIHQLSESGSFISVQQQGTNEPFFPVLKNISKASGADHINSRGQVLACNGCKNYLYQQWQAYEMTGTPVQHRQFKVPSELISESQPDTSRKTVIKSEDKYGEDSSKHICCYICGNAYISEHVRLLNTLPTKQSASASMFFPFVRELKRPSKAEPIRSDGSVIACIKCFGHLSYQWEMQESEGVPLYHRQYSLQFLSSKDRETEKVPKPSPSSKDQTQPLNIHISAGSPMQSNQNLGSNYPTTQGLLAIAATQSESMDSRPVSRCSDDVFISTKIHDAQTDLRTDTSSSGRVKTVPHPLQQVCDIPKKVCFLCAERCIIHKMKYLSSYPARHEAKHTNSQIGPFFPFLTNCTPAPGSDTLSEDGVAIVCKLCYYSLLKQWSEFETSTNPADSNRWLRKYTIPVYVCYVCGIENERKFMRSISVDKFNFLRDHHASKRALILDEGQKVVVCKSCAYSLMEQFAEYERMGVPLQLRKFNWKHRSRHGSGENVTEDESLDDSKFDSPQRSAYSGKSDHEQGEGGPPGSKPAPLNMMSPAGSKLQRNTATVSPLHHVTSPTNGVNSVGANAALNASRTSSFAAALRKLANQAKDGPEDGVVKSSSSTSPRDTVSKSGPPPLVYTSTTLTSPPVVTIAPTQSHPSLLASDSRPTLERLHSSSSMFETVSGKSDRPHSSASRDDDRASSRDTHSQSARRMTPHSTPGAVSPMSAREEGLGRGFQPYRPGDDLRPPLPSSLALDQAAAAAAAAYSYPAAFLPPHAFPHPAFRFDDPILLERYRMMQSPYLPYPQGMLPHPSLHPLLAAGAGRYPADLFPSQLAAAYSQSSRMPDHRSPSLLAERQRIEEEKQRELEREREKEKEWEKERELALQREKQRVLEREAEKLRERERLAQRELERRSSLDKARQELPHRDRGEDSLAARFGSVIQGTPKGLGIADRYPRVSSSSSLSLGRKDERRPSRDEYSFSSQGKPQPPPHKSYSDHDLEKRCSLVNPLREGDRDRARPPPLISPQSQDDKQPRLSKPETGGSALFRPFDSKQLPNGYEKNSSSSSDKKDRERDKLFHYRADTEDKKYPRDLSSISSEKDSKSSISVNNSRFGSLSSAFHSLDNHGSKTSIVSSLTASRNTQPHISSSLSSSSAATLSKPLAAHLGISHSGYSSAPLNVPSYNATAASAAAVASSSAPSSGAQNLITGHYSSSSFTSGSNSVKLSLESQLASPRFVSKLDLEERRRGEAHMDITCCSDSECDYRSEEDEKFHKNLLIASGPPLKLDTSPKKIKLFKELGLTTQRTKRDVVFERLRKRRRRMRERSLSPVSVEDEQLSLSPLKTRFHPEDLCQEPDYKHKCQFFAYFYRLEPVSPESRRVNDHMRKVCEAEQRRRMNVKEGSGGDNSSSSSSGNTSGSGTPITAGTKRKHEDTTTDSHYNPNKTIMSSLRRHDAQSSAAPIAEPKPLNIPHFPSSSSSQCSSSSGPSLTDRSNSAILSHRNSGFLAKNFVQEFHESVLQTTRHKEMSRQLAESQQQEEAHKRARLTEPPSYDRQQSSSSAASLSLFRLPGMYDWPGIEAVMETYHRHQQGEKLERQVLIGRHTKLKEENSDLNKMAERLSRRMEELLQSKRQLDDLRNHNQERIDSLKSTMKKLK